MIAFWHSEQSWKENGTNFRNIPKTLQCKDSANPSTAKQVKNQNLVQGILQSQLPCPTISQKRNPSIKLHHSGTGEKLPHTYTSDIPNPPLLPNTIFSSINSCFFFNEIPIPICWKACNTCHTWFLNQVILTELPIGKRKAVREVCRLTDHE